MKHGTPPALSFLDDALAEAERDHLLRARHPPPAPGRLCFCSNDYLALAERPSPSGNTGAGASRLVSGEREIHRDLEMAAAAMVGQPAALVFSSGYAANVGLLSALAGPSDIIVSDALNHASIIDGARLSRASVVVVPHLNVDAVDRALAERRESRAFVVTESYFSMDADSPDLTALRRAVRRPRRGARRRRGARPRGSWAGWPRALRRRPESALKPSWGPSARPSGPAVRSSRAAARSSPGCGTARDRSSFPRASARFSQPRRLRGSASRPASPLDARRCSRGPAACALGSAALGLRVGGAGPVVPWVVGESRDALRFAEALAVHGIDVRPIRPPSVPPGTARLRFTVTAAHSDDDIDTLVAAVAAALREPVACPRA